MWRPCPVGLQPALTPPGLGTSVPGERGRQTLLRPSPPSRLLLGVRGAAGSQQDPQHASWPGSPVSREKADSPLPSLAGLWDTAELPGGQLGGTMAPLAERHQGLHVATAAARLVLQDTRAGRTGPVCPGSWSSQSAEPGRGRAAGRRGSGEEDHELGPGQGLPCSTQPQRSPAGTWVSEEPGLGPSDRPSLRWGGGGAEGWGLTRGEDGHQAAYWR